ncbi:MAG: M67 family metallopeptidase [Endomicrobiales bacterium]|jgi:proteasome lid subunit RPN8/RPN11
MKVSKQLIDNIFIQGRAEAPVEACGVLAGKDTTAVKLFPMKNIDQSSEHFTLDPKEQFDVIRRARQEGLDILAVYHTHPETPARPSWEDIRLAYEPNIIYVIASLAHGTQSIKAFRIVGGEVKEEQLIIEESV